MSKNVLRLLLVNYKLLVSNVELTQVHITHTLRQCARETSNAQLVISITTEVRNTNVSYNANTKQVKRRANN